MYDKEEYEKIGTFGNVRMYNDVCVNSKTKVHQDCISNESLAKSLLTHVCMLKLWKNIHTIINNKLLPFYHLTTIAVRDEIALSTRATVVIISSLTINFP